MSKGELWVADASVVINILATGEPVSVLREVPGDLFAPVQVVKEVRKCPMDGSEKEDLLLPLIEGGYLQEVEVPEDALDIFFNLVGAPRPDGLDDGEAAVIACAVSMGGGAIIDETKGQRICREQFPRLQVWSSCDVFRYCHEKARIEGDIVRRWLKNAKDRARMSIPHRHRGWFSEMTHV